MKRTKPSIEPTTVAAYIDAITRALELAGADVGAVLQQAHVDRVRSIDPMLRIADSQINAIYECAVAITGDPYFGLSVAKCIVPGQLHALGYALLASDTLEDFGRRLTRYWSLVAQSADYTSRDDGSEFSLIATIKSPSLCFETQDLWAALVLRLMRMVYPGELRPLRVQLHRPMPAAGDAPYLDVFNCPVLFEQDSLSLHFDAALMREQLPGASRELAQQNDRVAMQYLEKLDREDIVNRVRAHIVNGMSGGSISRTAVAASVGMSASTLQVKLARAGLSFQKILDDTRRELALGYIDQSRLSITEIAFMLGFSDLSNFIRAFRRWTGISPTGFRDSSH